MPTPFLEPMPGAGFRSSGYRSGRLGVPIDGPNGWFVPTTAAHFQALGLNVPDYLFPLQEASGSIAATIAVGGALTMAATGAPLYAQTVPGWSRTFVGSTYDVAGGFTTTSALLDLATNQSFVMMMYAAHEANPVTTRYFGAMAGAGIVDLVMAAPTGLVRARHTAASQVSGTKQHSSVGATTVHQLSLYRNNATGKAGAITDLESIVNVYDGTAYAGNVKGLSPFGGSNATVRYGWYAYFLGANAEFDVAAYFAALRGG